MKKLFLLSLFVGISLTALNAQDVKSAQNSKETNVVAEKPMNGPIIKFADNEHNYGTIQKGGDGNCEFVFTNEGNEPLILSNVKASCGCTTPSWTKEPIMPGKTGTIKVHYNTNNAGPINKTITVSSNAINAARHTLKITGKVE